MPPQKSAGVDSVLKFKWMGCQKLQKCCRHDSWMVLWRSTLNQGTCQNFGPLKKLRHELRERQNLLLKLFGSNLGSELEDCRTFPLMMTTFGCQLLSSPGWIGFERMEGQKCLEWATTMREQCSVRNVLAIFFQRQGEKQTSPMVEGNELNREYVE